MPDVENPLPSPAFSVVRTRISERLQNAVRTSNQRQYHLAQVIDVHPSTLSGWLNGIFPVHYGEPRVIRLGGILGVPASECFEQPPAAEG